MCGVFEVSYTAPHTKTLYYKRGFFNNIYLFFRKIALPIVILMLVYCCHEKIEKFGCSRITKSGSYNTNKSIIQIDIPTQRRSSRGT
jgi:hypothetical protein